MGVAYQLTSIVSESIRLVMVQILLQVGGSWWSAPALPCTSRSCEAWSVAGSMPARSATLVFCACWALTGAHPPAHLQSRGLKLNPVTTLYYVAPCCFCFLLVCPPPWRQAARPP